MLIGVVSDTHLPRRAKQLPPALLEGLRSVDLILHCGDWSAMDAYDRLASIAPVDGVAGNTDGREVAARFGYRKLLEIEGKRVGIVHGHLGTARTTGRRALEAFADERVDLVLFGHSHIPVMEKMGRTLLFNPGSPTDKRRQPLFSYGLVTLSGGDIEARHMFFK